jgi:menaquinone-9 beta-reductase
VADRYDVAIAGGSFAGLACAAALGGNRRVVVLDRRPIGDGETSACALPVSTVRYLGLDETIEETQDEVVVWVQDRAHRFRLPEPYCTIDYRAFCERLAARCGAEIRIESVTGRDGDALTLTGGERIEARFLVDAAGWRRVLDPAGALDSQAEYLSFGAEEHVVYPDVRHVRGLHVYVRRDLARRGYAWNFPAGDHARAGAASYCKAPLQPGMKALREREAMGPPRARQGGALPHRLREPVVDGVLFVGDAAGHCLPLTAEGIRTAIAFADAAGRLMEEALAGRMSDDEARRRYAETVLRHAPHFRQLLRYQRVFPALPPTLLRAFTAAMARTPAGPWFTRRYVRRIQVGALPGLSR